MLGQQKSEEDATSDPLIRLKQAEAELRLMTKVFMDGADPIMIRDMEGRVLEVNHEVERVFGWSREELVGARTRHLLPPELRAAADLHLEQVQRGDALRNVEGAVRTKAGLTIPVLVTSFVLTDENGAAVGIANIIKDISRLKRIGEELERRIREIKQFAGAISHDLSAPLAAIRGFAQLLQRECEGVGEPADEYLGLILASVDRMGHMIKDLLDLTRLDGGVSQLEPVDCSRSIAEALANLRPAIADSAAEVTSGPLPTVVGNASQLTRVFQNLIGNAIKFRRDQPPRISVSAEKNEDGWQFAVADNGIGIAEKYRERIFDPFARVHAADLFPGTGIGLAICRAIVERHGGRIWVEPGNECGSVFRFTISDTAPAM